MSKRIAILQSNYLPWKGYFDLIGSVDEFVFYDDAQFTKNDWRNRNKIKTPKGLEWITVPVGSDISRKIRDVVISDSGWQKKHWGAFRANYGRAKYFEEVSEDFKSYYLSSKFGNLSDLNQALIKRICSYLGIRTKFTSSFEYIQTEGQNERLIAICKQAGAEIYVSGPAARDYIDEDKFHAFDIDVHWFSYEGYPEYTQLWGPFDHHVSIMDLLFNCGQDSPSFMHIGADH